MTQWIGLVLFMMVFTYGAYVILKAFGFNDLSKGVIILTILIIVKSTVVTLTPYIKAAQTKTNSIQNSLDRVANFGQGKWNSPIKGKITQEYAGKDHHGLDFAAPAGTKVKATREGDVSKVGWDDIYGNMIVIDHDQGMQSIYGHLSGIDIKVGYPVVAGQTIGSCGTTGHSTGPHLHFELRRNGLAVDPMGYL